MSTYDPQQPGVPGPPASAVQPPNAASPEVPAAMPPMASGYDQPPMDPYSQPGAAPYNQAPPPYPQSPASGYGQAPGSEPINPTGLPYNYSAGSMGQPEMQPNDPNDAQLMWYLTIILAFIAPLIFSSSDRSGWMKQNFRNAMNFQITMVLVSIIAAFISPVTFGLSMFVPFVWNLIIVLQAAPRVKAGEIYKAPMTLELIK